MIVKSFPSLPSEPQNSELELTLTSWLMRNVPSKTGTRIALRAGRVHVHIRRQPHFSHERDTSAGNAGGIGLFKGQLQMRSFDCFCYFLA